MTDTMQMPRGFEDLAGLAAEWAGPSENARSEVRWNASAADFKAFYDAMMPRLPDVLAELGRTTLEEMDIARTNLFSLAAAFAEAAPHHELYGGSSEVPFSFSARRFVPGHGDACSWATDFR
ncbi:MAG: hypothetical protein H6915_01215 [Novosphingobium sp.]|nr:hypothetical protein [Novosphingobium sp.]MCP5388365.1 hypothetical protein [Novosphingobium sp.]